MESNAAFGPARQRASQFTVRLVLFVSLDPQIMLTRLLVMSLAICAGCNSQSPVSETPINAGAKPRIAATQPNASTSLKIEDWLEYDEPELGFRLVLPLKPEGNITKANTPLGPVVAKMTISSAVGLTAGVVYTRYPDEFMEKAAPTQNQFLEMAGDGGLRAMKNTVLIDRTIKDTSTGLQLDQSFRFPSGQNSRNETVPASTSYQRVHLAGNELIVLLLEIPQSRIQQESQAVEKLRNDFFGSFHRSQQVSTPSTSN